MTVDDPTDGTLLSWDEVKDRCQWDTLLIGNGMSVNVWRGFAFASPYEEAERGTKFGGLSDEDKRPFKALVDTHNFELVLAKLRDAIRLAELLEQDPT